MGGTWIDFASDALLGYTGALTSASILSTETQKAMLEELLKSCDTRIAVLQRAIDHASSSQFLVERRPTLSSQPSCICKAKDQT